MTALSVESTSNLKAPPAAVFAAFTQADALRAWFAEHVDVDIGAKRYRFWGAHSYGVPTADDATQALLAVDAPTRLSYRWPIHGADGTVDIVLGPGDAEKNPGGTQVRVTHAFARAPDIGRARELVDDMWRIHLGNLQAFVDEAGAGITRPDFADPDPRVSASIYIAAPRERVFRSFLDPASLNRWIASAAEVDPRVGGRYSYGWKYPMDGREVEGGPTRILAVVENESLVTDWPDWRGDPDVPPQRITWRFETEGDGTRVTVVHDRFARAVDISDYPFGWPGFLGMLPNAFVDAPAA